MRHLIRIRHAQQTHGKEAAVIARIATFEGGDADEMRRRNNEMLVERGPNALPAGVLRVIVLTKDESRWAVISFFDDEETATAAEARFEELGNEIPESVRGKRVSLESYEVAFDAEMVRSAGRSRFARAASPAVG
jgi:hypothetical protein